MPCIILTVVYPQIVILAIIELFQRILRKEIWKKSFPM